MTSNRNSMPTSAKLPLDSSGHLPRPASCHPFQFRPRVLTLRDGTHVTIRTIAPEDEPRMVHFHQTLSEQSVHFRYFGMLSLGSRTGHERLVALCGTDPRHEIALVADQKGIEGEHEILGVGRLIRTPGLDEAEFALVITDRKQGVGLGATLLKLLVAIGRKAKVRIFGHILSDNAAMLHVSRNAGFELHLDAAAGEWVAELGDLQSEQKERDDAGSRRQHHKKG